MVEIEQGGQVCALKSLDKIRTIGINSTDNYMFELWINQDSLSYLSVNEMLKLKDEVSKALNDAINK